MEADTVMTSLFSPIYPFCICQDQLLFCDDCDRGYHMYCLNPPVAEPPEGNDDELNNNNNSNSNHAYPLLILYYDVGLVLRDFHGLSHFIIIVL